MAKKPVMGLAENIHICTLITIAILVCPVLALRVSSRHEQSSGIFFTYSSFRVPPTRLQHYDWTYIRVDLPSYFSSVSIELESDFNIEQDIDKSLEHSSPIICFRVGGPPLPDVTEAVLRGLVISSFFERSDGSIEYIQNVEQCYAMQKNITLNLKYGQIKPGVLYGGVFNGIGPIRTQSKMINKDSTCSFSSSVTVEACNDPTMWGPYCNQTVDALQCSPSNPNLSQENRVDAGETNNPMGGSVIACTNSSIASCHRNMYPKVYSLAVTDVVNQMIIQAVYVNTWATKGIKLMCYVRYGVLSTEALHDYFSDITDAPMVVHLPKVGTWYILVQPVNHQVEELGGTQKLKTNVCYTIKWELQGCPPGKAGPNCTEERYVLQGIDRENPTVPIVYLPEHEESLSLDFPNFPLEPLLSNSSSYGNDNDVAWTYFLLDVPEGAAGKNVHIQLLSKKVLSYEIYARSGGLPSLDNWDYSYSNHMSNSKSDSMFKLYDSSEGRIDLYILYAREGPWVIGLRNPFYMGQPSKGQTTMSISVKSCGNQCCGHGTCHYRDDASGTSFYSFCICDRTHGGFDCGTRTVSREEQKWESFSLVASNAAAVLPAFWALRQKAFADWVIYSCSGISSALYHTCDVRGDCVLPFHVLQFMDFWLSFMAVVCTFVYLTTISEAARRAIHTIASILTGLMAATSTTSSKNIGLVLAIGATGLLIGWLIEYISTHKSSTFSVGLCYNTFLKCHNVEVLLHNLIRTIHRRFRWKFVLLGSIAFSMAATSWKLETTSSYWIWHSVWHMSIFTASFFFICSKAATVTGQNRVQPDVASVELA